MSELEAIESLFAQGNEWLADGHYRKAEACFRQALTQAPEIAELHANLGLVLENQNQLAEAEACYRQALLLNKSLTEAHRNLGVLLAAQKRFIEAEQAYQLALQYAPASAVTWSNLGVLYACMQQEQAAESCYEKAIALDPAYRRARFNLSYLQLRQGRYDEGWASLEARDWYAQLEALFHYPRWQGESLNKKNILIGIEAGHGDMIHFCRYASILKDLGAQRVGLLCHPALVTLLDTHMAIDVVYSINEPIPTQGWDYWVPPMSMPYHCQTRLESLPNQLPYLSANIERISAWSKRIPKNGLRVGLVWKGNPNHENDADRSLPSLAMLAPLGDIPDVHYVSLQKGAGEEEANSPPSGLKLTPLGQDIVDFADTAAIVMQLDLVISIDSAIVHLAGALGKPCWVLLPDYKTDWRWLTKRPDSPWYPGILRLYRQKQQGNWADVINTIREDLIALSST